MRMRVLWEKLRFENENESSEGKMRLKLRMRLPIFLWPISKKTPNFQELGSD